MEQQQFKVSWSLGTKLLVSIVSLLFVVIVFLNVYVILILTQDKRAYVYDSQSKEAALTGREVVNTARHALDTLRLSLASTDPLKPVTPLQTAALKSVVDNQSDLSGVSIVLLDTKTSKLKPFVAASKKSDGTEDAGWGDSLPEAVTTELMTNTFAFVNLTRMGGAPTLGVALADTKFKDTGMGVPVALGAISMQEFASQLKGLSLTIATRGGRVLFDSDPAVLASKSLADNPLFQTGANAKLANGAMEFDMGGIRYLGSFIQPGLDLLVLNRVEWSKAIKATYTITEKFVVATGMAIGIAILFAIFFSKTLTRPIQSLYDATREVIAGKFDLDLAVQSSDEIGALTGSFNVMSRKISELIQESIKKAHLESELAIASTVQQTLIPAPNYQDSKIKITSHYQAASQCGGDWWGFFEVGSKVTIMIADATGHGFPSALITAAARSCFSVVHKLAQDTPDYDLSPSKMLQFANRSIYEAGNQKIMMTFFIGVLDFDKKTITYSNAGHNPPWLFRKDGAGYSLKSMMATGMRLGESPTPPAFEERSLPLETGDMIFLYTDGLMEGRSPQGEMYGKKRVRKVVEANLAQGSETTVANLMGDFLSYNAGKELDDDVTVALATLLV